MNETAVETFTPKDDAPPQVDVEIMERIATDAEVAKTLQDMGMVKVSEQRVAALPKLGAYLHNRGLIRTQRGSAFMTQQRLMDTMEVLHYRLHEVAQTKADKKTEGKKTDQMVRIAHELAFTAGKLTESQSLILGSDGGKPLAATPLPNAEAPPNASFPVGAIVPPQNLHLHVHKHEQKPPASG